MHSEPVDVIPLLCEAVRADNPTMRGWFAVGNAALVFQPPCENKRWVNGAYVQVAEHGWDTGYLAGLTVVSGLKLHKAVADVVKQRLFRAGEVATSIHSLQTLLELAFEQGLFVDKQEATDKWHARDASNQPVTYEGGQARFKARHTHQPIGALEIPPILMLLGVKCTLVTCAPGGAQLPQDNAWDQLVQHFGQEQADKSCSMVQSCTQTGKPVAFMEVLCEGHRPAVLVVMGCCQDEGRRRLVVVNPRMSPPWLLQRRLEYYEKREWKRHLLLDLDRLKTLNWKWQGARSSTITIRLVLPQNTLPTDAEVAEGRLCTQVNAS